MIICLDQRTGNGCGATNGDAAKHCAQCGVSLRFALVLRNAGDVVGAYRVVRVIGYGMFGAVYEAEDMRDSTERVAIKETFDTASISSFRDEFAILHGLHHPNLPQYYEMFEANDNGYLVMEYVPGQSLADVLDRQVEPLLEAQVLGYALQLCDVLHYLHQQQPAIVHRDIKPANVRLTPEGKIKLVDFGLLKQGTQQTRRTISGIGTPAYAPIEQYGRAGQNTDPRSDIYSLGATLYHLLTQQEPPPATERIAYTPDPLRSPRQYNPALSSHVANAVMGALGLAQKDRWESALTLKLALMGLARPAPISHNVPKAAEPMIWLKTLQGITAPVKSIAWSLKGHIIVGASGKYVVLWWLNERERMGRLQGHSDEVLTVAFNPVDGWMCSAGWDRSVRLWQGFDHRSRILTGHTDKVNSVAYSFDGHMLASAGWDEQIMVWDVLRASLLSTINERAGRVNSVAWSPDARYLASAGEDHCIRMYLVQPTTLLYTLSGHAGAVNSVAWSPDGTTLASGSMDGTVRLWQASNGALLEMFDSHSQGINSVAWSPDGQTIAGGSWDKQIHLWRIGDLGLQGTLERHNGCVWSVAWSPDGTMLASGSGDWTVQVWRLPKPTR